MTTRSLAYAFARFLGDVRAVQRGRIGRRLVNKALGRYVVARLWR
jgi:hypothetical protein